MGVRGGERGTKVGVGEGERGMWEWGGRGTKVGVGEGERGAKVGVRVRQEARGDVLLSVGRITGGIMMCSTGSITGGIMMCSTGSILRALVCEKGGH